MSYNRERLRGKIVDALDEFIPDDTLAVGRAAIIEGVTDVALALLKFICGDSDWPRPQGFLGYPIIVHQPCGDPTCVLCLGGADIVFGNPQRRQLNGIPAAPHHRRTTGTDARAARRSVR